MSNPQTDHQDWHGDHSDDANPIHSDSPGYSHERAEPQAPLLAEASEIVFGYETLASLSRAELHAMLHDLGLQSTEPRLGLAKGIVAEPGNAHWDFHNDQPERHMDADHPHHQDWGQHWDHTDAHGDGHSDSNSSHGDHSDGAKPHVDTAGRHVDGPNHEDSHWDHNDTALGHQDSSRHNDHNDAHTDYHCDLHKDHGDHTDEPKFVDA